MARIVMDVEWSEEAQRFNSHLVIQDPGFGPAHAVVAAYQLLTPINTPEMLEIRRLIAAVLTEAKPVTRH